MTSRPPHETLSDELLNSYIDKQITREERQEILQQINQDKVLAKRVCQLQQLKQMTQLAFDDIPPSRYEDKQTPAEPYWPRVAAAVAIFALGLAIGDSSLLQSQDKSMQLVSLSQPQDAAKQPIKSAKNMDNATTKVLIHLTSADVESGLNTLNNLEQLLLEYERNKQAVRVEVVANGQGIKLLRPAMHSIAQRIASLSEQYENLSFAACKNTIDEIQLSEGRLVDLIPEVKLIESGVVEVIRRQQDGWTYIRG